MLKGKHLIGPRDFTLEELDEILNLAHLIIENPKEYSKVCEGKLLAALFYEPSTRTRLSFEAAMHRLGGSVIGFSEANSSSTAKGETLEDTIEVVSNYSDIIAIRHPESGTAERAKKHSNVPIINAGDGSNEHPTQTLTDLLTIKLLKGSFHNNVIALCGDLKFGRTVHSLIKAMSRYENNKFILISPNELKLPDYIKKEFLIENNIEFIETTSLEEGLKHADILYMTRVQGERFENYEEYLSLRDSYILNREKLNLAKEDMIVMHPLPRVNEIQTDVDDDPRASYFLQAKYGMYVRMALIAKLLGCV